MKKNDRLVLKVESLGANAEGVCRHQGMVVFVPGTLPGETIEAQILKAQSTQAFGRLLSILDRSTERAEPPCPYVPRCGGCSCQHMSYELELAFKRRQVSDVMERIGGITMDVQPVLGMEHPWRYRNKCSMPAAMMDGKPRLGFYAQRSHRVIPVETCLISKPECDVAARVVRDWMEDRSIAAYDEEQHEGLVRHVMSRANKRGELMLLLVINGDVLPGHRDLSERLRGALPGFASLCVSPNRERGNTILGKTYRCLWGKDRLSDELCGSNFLLSPLSFFQVNHVQAEKLYYKTLELAGLQGNELVVDLYCGAGTISSLLGRNCREVVGIETVPQAVSDARANAAGNGLHNLRFLEGKAEDLLPQLVSEGLSPDVVVLDPPRRGTEPKVLQAILSAAPPRIVYVSCHPATQARDARTLREGGYRAAHCQPVDMFCHTPQVENILLMERG